MEFNTEEIEKIDTKQLTLLFVEDDPSTSININFILEKAFKKVYFGTNGQEGLELFIENQNEIDIVVTDIRMPKLDGTEMIKEIKKIKHYLPILVTTAFSDRDYLMQSIELGVNSYLIKPFKLMDLIEKIKIAYYPIIQEKKINDQYNLINSIVNAQNNFTILLDENYTLKMTNQTMLDFFGFDSLDLFINRYDCICDLFIKEEGFLQKEQNDKIWVDIIEENKDSVHKVKIKNLNNKSSIFYITTKEIEFQKRKHYVVVFNDITELEQLTQKKLIQQKHLAEHAKMAQMGSMVGSIAHQWRQPLSVISTIASGIQVRNSIGNVDRDQIEESMEKVLETTNYLSDTITTFRNFLKEKKEFKVVDIQDRLDVALKIVNVTLKENSITLNKNIDSDTPLKVEIVTGELVEVIINIINNAKDAICDRDEKLNNPQINITLSKKDQNAIIEIEDNAGGIPENILPKIFDEYFTTKNEHKGTGLGLFMSKQVIEESLRGKLHAQNTNQGAKFTIELPLA
jgi:signal transduction histidine kinase/DNA-binding response OmpR family regulator